ncbi:MAG: hypothetical protein ACRBK7_02580 [Acidimicrobiales bacterium]
MLKRIEFLKLLGSFVLAMVLAAGSGPHQQTFRASQEVTAISTEVNPGGVDAVPYWLQDGKQIGPIWFWPGERQAVWHVPTEGKFYAVSDESEAELLQQFPYAEWVFYSGFIFLIGLPGLLLLYIGLRAIVRDELAWRDVKQADSYVALSSYVEADRKWKRHSRAARARLVELCRLNVAWYHAITQGKLGQLGSEFAKLVQVSDNGEALEIGLQFETVNRIQSVEEIVAHAREEVGKLELALQRPDLDPDIAKGARALHAVYSEFLEINLQPAREIFDEIDDDAIQTMFSSALAGVLSALFPDPIVKIRTGVDLNAQMVVHCELRTKERSLYRRTGQVGALGRQGFPGVEAHYQVSLKLARQTLSRFQERSVAENKLTVKGTHERNVYQTIAASAFVNFGKRLLQEFGISPTNDKPQSAETLVAAVAPSAADEKMSIEELFEEFKDIYDSVTEFEENVQQLRDFVATYETEIAGIVSEIASVFEAELLVAAQVMSASIGAAGSLLGGLGSLSIDL